MIGLRYALAVACALLLGSCATAPVARDAGWFPAEARSNPDKHVVVTVRNGVNGAALGRGLDTPRLWVGRFLRCEPRSAR